MDHSSSPSLIVQSRNISSSHARRTHGPEYTPPTQPYPLRMNRSGARGTSTVCSTSHTSALSPPSALDQRTPPAHPGHVVLHQPCISACHACTRSETGSRSYATSGAEPRRRNGSMRRGRAGAMRRHGYGEAMRGGRAIRNSGGSARRQGCAWYAGSPGRTGGTGAVRGSTKSCGAIRSGGCSWREAKRAALSDRH